jgi:hypothetical protein
MTSDASTAPEHGARDLLRFVADALELTDSLRHGDDRAQVIRHRLPTRDERELLGIDAAIVCIHRALALDHALGALRIPFGVGQRGLSNLVEHEPAHLDDTHVERRQRTVERAAGVPFDHQPKRPVM